MLSEMLIFQKSMLASRPLDLALIAKVSDRKVFDCMQFKILTPKQMLQRLPIGLHN